MPTKTYSLKKETIDTINRLAKRTIRTQGAIVDIAVAELAASSVAADGGIDLPVVVPARKPRKIATRKKLSDIQGISKGMVN